MEMVQSAYDFQRFSYLFFSIFTISITDINSKTSTHWFFNEIKDQIVPGFIRCNNEPRENYQNSDKDVGISERCKKCCQEHSKTSSESISKISKLDFNSDVIGNKIMEILSDNLRIYYDNGSWEIKYSSEQFLTDTNDHSQNHDVYLIWEQNNDSFPVKRISDSIEFVKQNSRKITANPTSIRSTPYSDKKTDSFVVNSNKNKISMDVSRNSQSLISCYPYVNQTQYDHLNGIYYRDTYKYYPEPDVALLFTKRSKKNINNMINLENVEVQLIEAKAKRPNSPNVYNNIGNLLRVHGQSREAIECFRCALRLSPHHPDALLNMARVLFNQNYLEDAIYLTRHSLETQPRNRNPWLQHFTLGEILRTTGHKQEAQYHFLHVLELNPGFRPAKDYLLELSLKTNPITTIYSFCITIFLLSLAFYVVFLNVEFNDGENENQKSHRHFNRGMAMKTLRTLNSKPRLKKNI